MLEDLRRRFIAENRIYILPSGRGVTFLATVVVMVLTGATYDNNLVFLLAFLLFAVFVVAMLQTHNNLKGVRIEFIGAEEAFAEENQKLLFSLQKKRTRSKSGLRVRTRSRQFRTVMSSLQNMKADALTKSVFIEVRSSQRGMFPLPEIYLETFFPLGLFRAWKIFRPQGELTVYPKPEGSQDLEAIESDGGELETGLRAAPTGDFGELKGYQTGESYHQIAWKAYARSGQLYSKVHWGAEHRHYRIPWVRSLGQMSRWIVKAAEEDASFEMEMPTFKIPPGRGPEQARLCLRALAAYVGEEAK